jgi:hypothetical protein
LIKAQSRRNLRRRVTGQTAVAKVGERSEELFTGELVNPAINAS